MQATPSKGEIVPVKENLPVASSSLKYAPFGVYGCVKDLLCSVRLQCYASFLPPDQAQNHYKDHLVQAYIWTNLFEAYLFSAVYIFWVHGTGAFAILAAQIPLLFLPILFATGLFCIKMGLSFAAVFLFPIYSIAMEFPGAISIGNFLSAILPLLSWIFSVVIGLISAIRSLPLKAYSKLIERGKALEIEGK